MAPKVTKTKSIKKPILIKAGNHFIAPADIRCISSVKKGNLFIIKFYSDPNPEYACFVEPEDIGAILNHFNIVDGNE